MDQNRSLADRMAEISGGYKPAIGTGVTFYELALQLASLTSDIFHEEMARRGYPDVTFSLSQSVFRWVEADGSRPQDIAARAKITTAAVSQRVAQVVAMGYLDTIPVPGDGRGKLVVWTDKGRHVVEIAMAISKDIDTLAIEHFGKEFVEQLRGSMVSLFEVLSVRARGETDHA